MHQMVCWNPLPKVRRQDQRRVVVYGYEAAGHAFFLITGGESDRLLVATIS